MNVNSSTAISTANTIATITTANSTATTTATNIAVTTTNNTTGNNTTHHYHKYGNHQVRKNKLPQQGLNYKTKPFHPINKKVV